MLIIFIVSNQSAKRACFISTEDWPVMHLYSERRVSYGNNVNVHAVEAPVSKKPVLSSSFARTPL